jgi:hypothetical protein
MNSFCLTYILRSYIYDKVKWHFYGKFYVWKCLTQNGVSGLRVLVIMEVVE